MLSDLGFPGFIEGFGGDIRRSFVVPALTKSNKYSRISSYFKIQSLVAIGLGLDKVWEKNGSVRLLLGDHDLDMKLLDAFVLTSSAESGGLIQDLEARLTNQASKISNELEKDAIAAVAWLIHTDRLVIRIGATKLRRYGSILHNKRLVFEDEFGNIIAATGSQNETSLTDVHYEELSLHRSWLDSDTTRQMVESFETMWRGENEDLIVRELTKDLAAKLMRAIGRELPVTGALTPDNGVSLQESLLNYPSYSQFSLRGAALYPHQERALLDAGSRLPIRTLLADEVGLGKTLEAIALINLALRFGDAESVLIITPPNLMLQWQEGIFETLGIEFLRWDSGSAGYRNLANSIVPVGADSQPLGAGAPKFVLMSNAKFRDQSFLSQLNKKNRVIPDVIVVDEAHAARVNVDANSGKRKETLLWKRLSSITKETRHLLLLTATPMQVHPIEFFELLKLVGLPEGWDEYHVFERSLGWIAYGGKVPALPDAGRFAELLPSLLQNYGDFALDRYPEYVSLLNDFSKESDEFNRASLVRKQWSTFRKILILLHPASQLVIRNTRSALEPLGYKFPERVFSAPDLKISDHIFDFHDELRRYLSDGFGITEEAQGNSRAGRGAFQKSKWWERTASSLFAAQKSISNRIAKLEWAADGSVIQVRDDEWGEASIFANQLILEDKQAENVRQSALKEISYLSSLKTTAGSILSEFGGQDPKFLATRDIVSESLDAHSSILVFSRWVHTLEGCIEFLAPSLNQSEAGYGMYTGEHRWITRQGIRRDVNKQDLVAALNSGEIKVVFCSEAASEGLNLQAANRLLNIDVPWNPAKLEQRIGRIARLGQASSKVTIFNLWYPGSIEARMYDRLLARKELFGLAVGEMPSLFSDEIEKAISLNLDPAASADAAGKSLEKLRGDIQNRALREVWNHELEDVQASTKFRGDLLAFLINSSSYPEAFASLQVDSGTEKPVTLWPLFESEAIGFPKRASELAVIVLREGISAGFACVSREGRLRLIKPEKLFSWLVDKNEEESNLFESEWFFADLIKENVAKSIQRDRWLPSGAKAKLLKLLETTQEVEIRSISSIK
jgi:superfamily II DNA or RNA helicase